jgi:gamma-glutamylcyclotransferase (GGCT)/AIG2-like uncharacterized protein YtfP
MCGDTRHCQAENPLIVLSRFPEPALLNRAAEGFVLDEVLRFENIEAALARFDRIEGFYGFGNSKNLFRRTVTTFNLDDGLVQPAWTYVTTRPEAPAIPSNDWRVHCGRRLDFVEKLVAEHASRKPKPNFLERMTSAASSPFDSVPHACRRWLMS